MSTHQQQFQNDNVSVMLSREPGCRVRMEVAISPLAAKAAYEKATKVVGKEVSVPGFRKGKAPSEMIRKNFGKHVDQEWRDVVLNSAFRDAIELTKIYPFTEKSVNKANLKTISLQDGATVSYEYEAHPEIPNVDPKECAIKVIERKPVTDKDVNQTIENLRLQKAEWQEITARPAEEGDYVDITIDAIEEPVRNICKNMRFELAAGKMGDWMRQLLIGMSPGESGEKMSEKESGHDEHDEHCTECESGDPHHHHEHFKPTLCRITLHNILKPTLPELDDELAKKFGINTLEELKTRVANDLNKNTEEEHQNTQRALMEKALFNKYRFDVPYSLVAGQLQEREAEITSELISQGVNEDILDQEVKNVQRNVAERLLRDYCLYFLAQKIANDNNIQINQDELMQELMRQLWLQQSGQSIINANMDAKEVRSRLYASLLVNKALDFLIEHSKNA